MKKIKLEAEYSQMKSCQRERQERSRHKQIGSYTDIDCLNDHLSVWNGCSYVCSCCHRKLYRNGIKTLENIDELMNI